MIERFQDAGHHVGWVTGDEVYGGKPKLRTALEDRGIGYVLAGACSAEVPTGAGRFRRRHHQARSRTSHYRRQANSPDMKITIYSWSISCPTHGVGPLLRSQGSRSLKSVTLPLIGLQAVGDGRSPAAPSTEPSGSAAEPRASAG